MGHPERLIENKLIATVESLGGKCYKWTSPGRRGPLDQIVVFPGIVAFVECKSQNGRVTIHQEQVIEELGGMGHFTAVIYTLESAQYVAKEIHRRGEACLLAHSTALKHSRLAY